MVFHAVAIFSVDCALPSMFCFSGALAASLRLPKRLAVQTWEKTTNTCRFHVFFFFLELGLVATPRCLRALALGSNPSQPTKRLHSGDCPRNATDTAVLPRRTVSRSRNNLR